MTSIEWTDKTWNPTRGCSRVSKGCEHCYAEGVARRFAGKGQPYEGLVRLTAEGKPKAQWNGVVRLAPEKLAEPLSWRKPQRVFVNSMSDLFHEALPVEDVDRVFAVMQACTNLTFQVLTKRPEVALRWSVGAEKRVRAAGEQLAADRGWCHAHEDRTWPLDNVWIGVSVEDQATADERIPELLSVPTAKRFVSYEPAIGPVRFDRLTDDEGLWYDALRGRFSVNTDGDGPRLDWVIVGGESGPGARSFDVAWARSTIAQCREAGVACFVKQLGRRPVTSHDLDFDSRRYPTRDRAGGDMSEWPEDLRVREFPHA